MMRLWSFICTAIGSLLLAFCVAAIAVPSLRILPAQILVENDQPSKGGDGIILLMGDAVDRAPHAADLLKTGYGKYIVFVETETDELMRHGIKPLEGQLIYAYLTRVLKVPADKIVFDREARVSSTEEEARALLKILSAHDLRKNILTTSWYHSSRAAWIFRRVMVESGNKESSVQSFPSALPIKWYQKEKDFLSVYTEYLKWTYYYIRYDVFK
ncbi:MAG: YdcF family protein [Proteobacteria bacterium]|nr:MAG: YdcF family protein [Pseudomonadota bacterium]